jgi:hypothetical protein
MTMQSNLKLNLPLMINDIINDDSAEADVVVKWQNVVDLIVPLGDFNSPAFMVDAYEFLRNAHGSIPYPVLGAKREALKGLPLHEEFLRLITPQDRRLNLVLRDQIDKARGQRSDRTPDIAELREAIIRPDGYARPAARAASFANRRDVKIEPFDAAVRDSAKMAFTLRRVPLEAMHVLISGAVRPVSGDIVLARVDKLRHQGRLELPTGRKSGLDEGSLIMVAYGDRYATDQFEAHVPLSLKPTNLIAVGGVASDMLSKSSAVRGATEITPIGLVGNQRGEPLNLRDFALVPTIITRPRPRVIAVLGTSMNSGKTTTIRFLLNGLSKANLKPGATKVTGTGSGGDYWTMVDAGAHRMLDFTDVGYASTFRISTPKLERAAFELVDHLIDAGSGVILVEVADGLYHHQNRELIETDFFKNYVDGVLFAAGDSLAAFAGVSMLNQFNIPVIGVSGKLTASELMAREARTTSPVPVYTREDLRDPVRATIIAGMSSSHQFWTSQSGLPFPDMTLNASLCA